MESESSLPYSQVPTTSPYPQQYSWNMSENSDVHRAHGAGVGGKHKELKKNIYGIFSKIV